MKVVSKILLLALCVLLGGCMKWEYGDSEDFNTSGEGLFGAKEEEDWIPMFFSALKDYAYLTAKELDAEYQIGRASCRERV